MNNETKPTVSPSPALPVEAEVRADDLERPSPDDAAEVSEELEAKPGDGENAPGVLKPGKK